MERKFIIRGADARCPICGREEHCFDGLAEGSQIPCGGCGATMTVADGEWCTYRRGMIPVFAATVTVTGKMLDALHGCRTHPQVPATGHQRRTFGALLRRGLVECLHPSIGYEATREAASQLAAAE